MNRSQAIRIGCSASLSIEVCQEKTVSLSFVSFSLWQTQSKLSYSNKERRNILMKSLFRLGLIAAFVALLSVTISTLDTKPAHAKTCIHPTLKYYPGSAINHIRYGEVNFHFDLCDYQEGNEWGRSVSRITVNATGANLGFFLDGASVNLTSSDDWSANYDGKIYWKTCTPRVGWPCSHSGSFTIKFHATHAVRGTLGVSHTQIIAPDIGLTIFTTP
jgi:hypothetical protein